MHKALCCVSNHHGYLQKKYLYHHLSGELNQLLSSWNILFTWKNSWQLGSFRLDCMVGIFLKMHQVSLSHQGKATDNICFFELLNKNSIFKNLVSGIISLTASQYLKTFQMSLVWIIMNVVFWYCVMKWVNIWKKSTTQGTNIFQIVNAWCYKIMQGYGQNIHSKCMCSPPPPQFKHWSLLPSVMV